MMRAAIGLGLAIFVAACGDDGNGGSRIQAPGSGVRKPDGDGNGKGNGDGNGDGNGKGNGNGDGKGSDAAAALPHQIVPDLATALTTIITAAKPRVVGIGELHQRTDRATTVRSALGRFTEALPAIAPGVSDLVLETWVVDPKCGRAGQTATAKVEAEMRRPPTTRNELGTLVDVVRTAGIKPHVMTLTCDDYQRVAGGAEVDHAALLGLVTRELGRVATSAVQYRDRQPASRPLVAIYGGALHNDRFPRPGVADWSYAAALDAATTDRLVEIDLYVPEYAEADAASAKEPWFPLLTAASPEHVVVIERGPRSYLILLPRSPPAP